VLSGDVEVHVNASDWTGHGHHRRAEYDGVALHVVMWNDTGGACVVTASGRPVPQVALADALTQPLGRVAKQVETNDYPYRKRAGMGECAAAVAGVRPAELAQLMMLAGEWRVQEKAERFNDWLHEHDFDEVLYRAVMEALGYAANKEAMRALAERVPLRVLREFAEGQQAGAGRYAIQAVLLGVSGLLPPDVEGDWDNETRTFCTFLQGVWEDFRRERSYLPMDAGAWSSAGRPANSPMRRIAAASLWLQRTRHRPMLKTLASLLDGLNRTAARFDEDYARFRHNLLTRAKPARGNAVNKACREALRRLTDVFDAGEDAYWSRRFVLGGRELARPVALVGQGRLQEIVVNVVVPVLLLYVRHARPELESALLMLYHAASGGAGNAVTRRMRHQLFGAEREPLGRETAVMRQGLLQLFKDYCSKDTGGCIGCRFRENLERWISGRAGLPG
jgi:hypothetical protein